MNIIKLLTLTLLFLFTFTLSAAPVIIKGHMPGYAGEAFNIYIQSNPILEKDSLLAKTNFSDSGHFSIEIEINQTIEVYTYLGTYKGKIFIEPNHEYHLQLPARREKTRAQKYNPYFKPTSITLGIKKHKKLETGNHIPGGTRSECINTNF